MRKKEFNDFFKLYAQNVDKADKQYFWKLSDALIIEIIKKNIFDPGESGTILDAGGGSARWAIKLCEHYRAHFTVYDLSEDMLVQARHNLLKSNFKNRVTLVHGDIVKMNNIATGSIDHILSIYSPLSFIDKKAEAISEMYRILKPGGKIAIMGHGHYNAVASKINNSIALPSELYKMNKTYRVKWAQHVPELNTFSKESLENLLSDSGFTPIITYGVPVFIQPGPEDFDLENKKYSKISKALENRDFFESIFSIEMEHNSKSTVINRGMNVFSIATKHY